MYGAAGCSRYQPRGYRWTLNERLLVFVGKLIPQMAAALVLQFTLKPCVEGLGFFGLEWKNKYVALVCNNWSTAG